MATAVKPKKPFPLSIPVPNPAKPTDEADGPMSDQLDETKPKPVPLIDRIPAPKAGYDLAGLNRFCYEQLMAIKDDRSAWLQRRTSYIRDIEDFIQYERDRPFKDSCNLHIPTTLEKVRATHARFFQALTPMRSNFFVEPQERLDEQRIHKIKQIMRWSTTRFVNYYRGIETAIDDWAWDVPAEGWGILKLRWDRKCRKCIDVEAVVAKPKAAMSRLQQAGLAAGGAVEPKAAEPKFREVIRWEEFFNGPVVEVPEAEDCYFPGRGDFDWAPLIGFATWLTESDIRYHIASRYFDKSIGEQVLNQPDPKPFEFDRDAGTQKQVKDNVQGLDNTNQERLINRFNVFECFVTYDIDNDGMDEELVVHYHPRSRSVLRWTYLDRVNKTGRRPVYKADYIRRRGRNYSMGLCELLYPLSQEVDAVHNQRVDFGTLSNLPFFFYKATSTLPNQMMELTPGKGIPLENPREDVFFPQFRSNTAWGFQEEQSLFQLISRISSISEMASGVPPSPAEMTRTSGGVSALLNEGNAQLDVTLKRMQGQLSLLYGDLHQLLADRLPKDFEHMVVGDDGRPSMSPDGEQAWQSFTNTREEIKGRVHFQIMANSRAANKDMALERAIRRQQMVLNPLNLQAGIVNAQNIYELQADILEKDDELDIDRFLTKPQDMEPPLSLQQEVDSIQQGLRPKIVLHDDHQAKIQALSAYRNSPVFLGAIQTGRISKDAMAWIELTIKEHQQIASAIAAQQQVATVQGGQMNPAVSGAIGLPTGTQPSGNPQGGGNLPAAGAPAAPKETPVPQE